ncbi:MAG: hypothetical protein IPK16_16265 [Anaerolineales bacterium]|nr:hypothetical protein [Anaerolineales bacterium]
MLAVAAQSDLGPTLIALLRACGDASGCEAPAAVMHSLHELPSTALTREAVAIALVMPPQRSHAQRLAWHYARFRRIAAARGIAPSPAAALSYLRSVRGRSGAE